MGAGATIENPSAKGAARQAVTSSTHEDFQQYLSVLPMEIRAKAEHFVQRLNIHRARLSDLERQTSEIRMSLEALSISAKAPEEAQRTHLGSQVDLHTGGKPDDLSTTDAHAEQDARFRDRDSKPLLVPEELDNRVLKHVKLLAADLDKTLYPNGMGNAKTPPTEEARTHFEKNIKCFMEFMGKGRLAIPVTGNSPAMAQKKFDRSGIKWKVSEHPGVFCNGALVQGVGGAIEYTAAVADTIMEGITKWLSKSDGLHDHKYPFAVICLTKDKVLYLPPGKVNEASQSIADGWAAMQLMLSDTAHSGHDWRTDPAFQVNLCLKSKKDFLKDFPEHEVDSHTPIDKIQQDLLDDLEKEIGKLSDSAHQGKHVMAPWLETNIVQKGVNKGQSLNRFIHAKSVQDRIREVSVGTHVVVAGDAANDLPMFLEWGPVSDFNGQTLSETDRPAIRIIMPDSEDEQLQLESNVKGRVYEVIEAVLSVCDDAQ